MTNYKDEALDILIEKYREELEKLPIGSVERQRAIDDLCKLENLRSMKMKQSFDIANEEERLFREAEAEEAKELRERKESKRRRTDSYVNLGVNTVCNLLGIIVPAAIALGWGGAMLKYQEDGHIPDWLMKAFTNRLLPDSKRMRV